MEENPHSAPEDNHGQDTVKKKRGWEENDSTEGQEKMAKMGLACTTCGRPYDYAFFPQRIVQLSQKVREYEHPDQPKEKAHAWTDEEVIYLWEEIQKLEEKLKAKKSEKDLNLDLGLDLKPKQKPQTGARVRRKKKKSKARKKT